MHAGDGSVTRYWNGTVTPCYWVDWLRNKIIIHNWRKRTLLWIWRWISHRDCRNVSWQWLVTKVAWASGPPNSGKQSQVLIEWAIEKWIILHVLSCYMKMTSPSLSWLPATEFWLNFFFGNKSLILMWVYHLCQNEWLFWYRSLYKWREY